MKVGIVFDNQLRSETTGFYCRRALSRVSDVEHLLPDELANVPSGLFDLFVLVDDGLDYEIPDHFRPRAAWAIDTHMNLNRCIHRFGDADWVFAAQKLGAAQMREALSHDVHWLPLACDPSLHHPTANEPRRFDIGFIGHEIGSRRQEMLAVVREHFSNCWIGQAFHAQMALRYSQCKLTMNCSIAGDINMRVFEALACGTPLITDSIIENGLEELFEIGHHFICYDDADSLLSSIRKLLEDESRRQRLAEQGRRHVLTHHTYDQRIGVILDRAEAVSNSVPKPRLATKSPAYFEFERPDVASLVPSSARKLLDVGCGSGMLGAMLKKQRECTVTGVELSPQAAQSARQRLDRVVECSIDDLEPDSFEPFAFDCILFADVLEHLRAPEKILQMCRTWLAPGGSIVISIPNSRHHSVVRGLIEGNWTYEHAGLLDEDHVRCFTRRELEKLLFRTGFEPVELVNIPGDGYQSWKQAGEAHRLDFGSFTVAGVPAEETEEFFVYQFIVRAEKTERRLYPRTSIVIVTFNQLAYTRQCVESILARTDVEYELIFVDNGSTDGTSSYLNSLSGAKVILNDQNRGFAPAVNQAIRIASGEQILLLNNDTIVTTGWLEGLLEALYDRPDTGLVGPVSNCVSGPQQMAVAYDDLSSMDGFAWALRTQRQMTQVDRLVGFCLLMRRELIERIGLLDEQFEIGCFEDDDLCRRALAAGFKAYIVSNVFVHHFGSVTFQAAGFDFAAIMDRNKSRYDAKWQVASEPIDPSADGATPFPPLPESPSSGAGCVAAKQLYQLSEIEGGELLLQRKQVRLSLCMIVRDNEGTIDACLESVYPWVDEIIVVDTGSTDRTQELCRSYGARISEFPWCDDFSAARNASLELARGEWIFWMDSDDVMPQQQGRQLRELALGPHSAETYGYVMQVHCPSDESGQLTIVDHVKLIRNLPELRFEHRIHEQILPAIRRAGGTVGFTEIYVMHSGSRQTPEVRQRKLERDFRILALDLQQRPDHPFVLFNLGMTCEDAGQYVEAEEYLRRCIDVSTAQESHLRKAWSLRVNCLRSLGRLQEAIEMATSALETFVGDKELLFRRAMLYQDVGQLENARTDYERVLNEPVDRVFQSIDPSICGYKAHHNLALTLQGLGRFDEAAASWERATSECPEFRPAWLDLVRTCIELGEHSRTESIIDRIPDTPNDPTRSLAKALLLEAQGNFTVAQTTLENAWNSTGDVECLDELSRILVATGYMESAIPKLRLLQRARPNNAAVLHNLGAALHAVGQLESAIPCLRESLLLRPDASHSSQLLAAAYHCRGDSDRAREVLEAALRLQPHSERLLKALSEVKPQA